MNTFYRQPLFLQWILSVMLIIIGFIPALYIIEVSFHQPLYCFLFFIYLPFGQFSMTPFFKLIGVYTYYSPMLLGYMANNVVIDLHSGSSFDYLFVMRKYPVSEYRNRILEFHLRGLLTIIERIENGKIPKTVIINATSYFFNERTMKKYGFQSKEPSLFYRLNLLVNFFDLFWMYSLSKGKIALPKVWKARKGVATGVDLVDKKAIIVKTIDAIGRNKSNTL